MNNLQGIPKDVGAGHNSGAMGVSNDKANSADKEYNALIKRYENLEVQKQNVADDSKELLKEIKNNGIDLKAFKRVIKERKIDPAKREEEEQMFLFLWDKAQ